MPARSCYNPPLFMGRIMARNINRLSAKAVETIKRPGRRRGRPVPASVPGRRQILALYIHAQ